MGRKALSEGEGKTHMMRVRMTLDERDELTEAAKASGLTVSEWARGILLASARSTRAKPVKKKSEKPSSMTD